MMVNKKIQKRDEIRARRVSDVQDDELEQRGLPEVASIEGAQEEAENVTPDSIQADSSVEDTVPQKWVISETDDPERIGMIVANFEDGAEPYNGENEVGQHINDMPAASDEDEDDIVDLTDSGAEEVAPKKKGWLRG